MCEGVWKPTEGMNISLLNVTLVHSAHMQLKSTRKCFIMVQEYAYRDFPGGPVVKNPSCNAGEAGSIPGLGTKIQHAAGQLSPRATTRQPVCRN